MHSSVAVATMSSTSDSPTNTIYSDYGWCGPSPEDSYNENFTPHDPLGHPGGGQTHAYYDYHHSQTASHHHHNHSHPGYGANNNNNNEMEDCCSGSGTEYGGYNTNSRSPPPGSTYLWDCPPGHHGNPSPGPLSSPPVMRMEGGRPSVKRRTTANKKERRRTQSINNAFAELRDCIPNVPADTKLSKIKTLRLATSYIAYLSEVLSGDDPSRTPAAFTAEVSRKLARGDEKRKKELLMAELSGITGGGTVNTGTGSGSSGSSNHNSKPKGRTGWPQHVWALELQQ